MRGTDGGAGASAWARYRMLSAEHRQSRIVARLVLAGAVGALTTGFTGSAAWWAAPVVAMGFFSAHAVYLRRRPGSAAGWRQGALAERRTGRRLGRLDPAAFRVLHDRALPGAPSANLDHLVIGLTGVYAIASRKWRRRIRLQADRRRIWAGDRPLIDLPAAAGRSARTVADALAAEFDQQVRVTAVIAVHGARLPRAGLRHGVVVFLPVRRLPAFIRGRPVVLTSAQVASITAAAERLLPPMTGDRAYRHRVNGQ